MSKSGDRDENSKIHPRRRDSHPSPHVHGFRPADPDRNRHHARPAQLHDHDPADAEAAPSARSAGGAADEYKVKDAAHAGELACRRQGELHRRARVVAPRRSRNWRSRSCAQSRSRPSRGARIGGRSRRRRLRGAMQTAHGETAKRCALNDEDDALIHGRPRLRLRFFHRQLRALPAVRAVRDTRRRWCSRKTSARLAAFQDIQQSSWQ